MWASRSYARSPGTVCLGSGSCTSARAFAPRFFQTPPRDDALALRYDFTSIRLSKGLSPSSCRTCSAHTAKGRSLRTALIESLLLTCLFADLQIHHRSFAAVERTQRF